MTFNFLTSNNPNKRLSSSKSSRFLYLLMSLVFKARSWMNFDVHFYYTFKKNFFSMHFLFEPTVIDFLALIF